MLKTDKMKTHCRDGSSYSGRHLVQQWEEGLPHGSVWARVPALLLIPASCYHVLQEAAGGWLQDMGHQPPMLNFWLLASPWFSFGCWRHLEKESVDEISLSPSLLPFKINRKGRKKSESGHSMYWWILMNISNICIIQWKREHFQAHLIRSTSSAKDCDVLVDAAMTKCQWL